MIAGETVHDHVHSQRSRVLKTAKKRERDVMFSKENDSNIDDVAAQCDAFVPNGHRPAKKLSGKIVFP